MKIIKLTRGLKTMVDNEDYTMLMCPTPIRKREPKWTAVSSRHGKFYAASRRGKMARIILNAKEGEYVDHINGNTLDNRRSNLRVVTKTQNDMNRTKRKGCRSKYKGVYWDGNGRQWRKPWRAWVGGKSTGGRIHLGRFEKEKEAALAYNSAAKEHFGAYALLNRVS